MDPELIVTFWFTIGMVFHVLPRLRKLEQVFIFGAVLIGSFLLSLIPDDGEVIYSLKNHLVFYFFISMGATFLALREAIIPRVNENIIVLNTAIFLYVLGFLVPTEMATLLALGAIVPTGFLIHSIIEKFELDPAVQIFLYFWNEVMFIVLFVVQYSSFIALLPTWEQAEQLPVLQLIAAGMMFASITLPVMGLIYLIPMPSKHQTLGERLLEIKQYLREIAEHFTDENVTPIRAVVTVLTILIILFINRLYRIVPDFTVISVLIVAVPFVMKPGPPAPPPMRILSMHEEAPQSSK